jgi:hypothetical protein
MDTRTAGARGRIRWDAVVFGWAVAVLVGILTNIIFRQIYGLLAEPPAEAGELTATVVVLSGVSGFLSYLVGGYAAAKRASRLGGRHGALTAVFGLIAGVVLVAVLVLLGVVLQEGIAEVVVLPASVGPIGAVWAFGAILFLINLFGGLVGGKLGEPFNPDAKRLE